MLLYTDTTHRNGTLNHLFMDFKYKPKQIPLIMVRKRTSKGSQQWGLGCCNPWVNLLLLGWPNYGEPKNHIELKSVKKLWPVQTLDTLGVLFGINIISILHWDVYEVKFTEWPNVPHLLLFLWKPLFRIISISYNLNQILLIGLQAKR